MIKYAKCLGSAIILFTTFTAGYFFGNDNVVIKEVTKYKTVWKQDTTQLTFKEAIGHIDVPLRITHTTKKNVIFVTCQDDIKSVSQDITFEYSNNGWKYSLLVLLPFTAYGTYKIYQKLK
ncbi:MAG: hypothetical protein GY853_15360 [PVC group bacterium]|nr:hypothetical protein [PVC group bacterium]